MVLVMKFGGTSVGSGRAIQRTAELIAHSRPQWPQVVVVASAMSKVTDTLLQGATTAANGDPATYKELAQTLRERHYAAILELLAEGAERRQLTAEMEGFVDRFQTLCAAVLVLGEVTPRALDAITSMGEQMSVRILAAALRLMGQPAQAVDARELIITDDNFQAAAPLPEQTAVQCRARLRPLLEQGLIPVVTGFMAATQQGLTTTLGRGGSDYSAAILGQAIQAQEVWIWTDVDGVMTADPRLAADARTLPTLTYREVAELAYYGAKVLHPKTIRPVVENNIPLRIKNTFNPDHPGTLIVPDGGNGVGELKAVTAIEQLSLITVEGKGMMGVPGIAARTFGAVARAQVSVLLISQASSEQSICFIVPDETTGRVVASLEAEFAVELHRQDIDRIWAQRPVSIVTVVGAGMRGTPGIAGRIFGALGQGQVNVIAIAQGSSECSVSMVVDGKDTVTAVRQIHGLIVM
ncbi:MAG: aspartate kinase [Chloroflexota bacterium]